MLQNILFKYKHISSPIWHQSYHKHVFGSRENILCLYATKNAVVESQIESDAPFFYSTD